MCVLIAHLEHLLVKKRKRKESLSTVFHGININNYCSLLKNSPCSDKPNLTEKQENFFRVIVDSKLLKKLDHFTLKKVKRSSTQSKQPNRFRMTGIKVQWQKLLDLLVLNKRTPDHVSVKKVGLLGLNYIETQNHNGHFQYFKVNPTWGQSYKFSKFRAKFNKFLKS